MEKICKLCGNIFIPSKYRAAAQEICSGPVCQHKRQLENMKRWRKGNPYYFQQDAVRGAYWREIYRRRIRRWRREHSEYFKRYRQIYKDRHRDYMREYMRRYRGIRKMALMESGGIQPNENIQPPVDISIQPLPQQLIQPIQPPIQAPIQPPGKIDGSTNAQG